MIFPFFDKLKDWKNYPVTWAFLFLNIIICVHLASSEKSSFLDNFSNEKAIMETAGRVYFTSVAAYELPEWALNAKIEDLTAMQMLGAFALRQDRLMRFVLDKKLSQTKNVDEVQLQHLEKYLVDLNDYKANSESMKFGLRDEASTPLAWITYQFAHSEVSHLLGNIFYLVLFGALIEIQFGGLLVAFTYLFGGILGGAFYLYFNQQGSAPMIGASASVTALMSFFIFYYGRKNIPFAYFLGPFKGFMGVIYLPAIVLAPLLFFDDIVQLMSAPAGLSYGVAHASHIGGAIAGLMISLYCRGFFFGRSKASA